MKTKLSLSLLGALAPLSALALGACLQDKAPHLDCGNEGDAFAYAGADYCVYSSAIIIEGFDCPAAVPFGTENGGLLICAPTNQPPADGGFDGLVSAFEQAGHDHPDAGDASDTSGDTTSIDTSQPDTGPVDTGPCVTGLTPGQCWDASQCPDGWSCEGAAPACTPCVDCPDPIPGAAGSCAAPAGSGDQLALVAWPHYKGAAGDVAIGFWYIATNFYTVLECPSFALEFPDNAGGFVTGPSESECAGPISAPTAQVIVRPGPNLGNPNALIVRASGRYRTGCASQDPASCTGEVDITSQQIQVRGL